MVHRLAEDHREGCGNRPIKRIRSCQKNRHRNNHRQIPSEGTGPEGNHSQRFLANQRRIHLHLRNSEIEQWSQLTIGLHLHPTKSEISLPGARLPRRLETLQKSIRSRAVLPRRWILPQGETLWRVDDQSLEGESAAIGENPQLHRLRIPRQQQQQILVKRGVGKSRGNQCSAAPLRRVGPGDVALFNTRLFKLAVSFMVVQNIDTYHE